MSVIIDQRAATEFVPTVDNTRTGSDSASLLKLTAIRVKIIHASAIRPDNIVMIPIDLCSFIKFIVLFFEIILQLRANQFFCSQLPNNKYDLWTLPGLDENIIVFSPTSFTSWLLCSRCGLGGQAIA